MRINMRSSPQHTEDTDVTIWEVDVPRRLLILPATGFALGLFIGMSRGGSRARLRFLAENAHRQPTTIQGWYFYTKTRNYRILFGALKQGSRDAMIIGAATTFYVLAEETISSIRFNLLGSRLEDDLVKRYGSLGDLQYMDKGLAGGMMGSVIGALGKFPPGLFLRTLALGSIFGTIEGGLVMAQEKVQSVREANALAEPMEKGVEAVETGVADLR